MFFEKSKAAVIISSNSITVVSTLNISEPALTLTKDVIDSLEVLNSIAYKDIVKSFFEKIKLTNFNVIIILQNDIVYSTKFSKAPNVAVNDLINEFETLLPHDKSRISVKEYEDGQDIILFGVNRDLYTFLVQILKELGNEIYSVIPEQRCNISIANLEGNTENILALFSNEKLRSESFPSNS